MNSKECLERLFDDYEYLIEEYYPRSELIESQLNKTKNNVNKIIQDLDKLEKLEKENAKLKKVIEVLCANNIHIRTLKLSKNVDEYNSQIEKYSYYDELEQKEFDLLKEVFGNEN